MKSITRLGLFGMALLALVVNPALAPRAVAQDAAYVGEAKCEACHTDDDAHYTYTLHAKAFRANPKNEREKRGCEACHGPGSRHVAKTAEKGTIIGFTREWGTPVEVQNAQCLGCHSGGGRLHWPGSAHALNVIACSDCHAPMARFSRDGLLRASTISETCQTCHQQQRAEFRRRSHMPVPEGKMSCVDCHNPHGSVTRPMLKADSVNETCYACHAEKRGPFLWEHAPVRENCANCHLPHGHSGQFYRGDQTAAAALQGGTQSARIIGRSCQNCHVSIHGSNHPSGARFQR